MKEDILEQETRETREINTVSHTFIPVSLQDTLNS
jgi:hypothetical protein